MAQRVNIQYSVDLRDLNAEVKGLVNRALVDLHNLVQNNNFQDCEQISLQMVREIDEFRQRLADIDLRLGDVSDICTGYLQFETKRHNKQPAQEPTTPVDQVPNPLDNIDELKQTLKDFKSSLPVE